MSHIHLPSVCEKTGNTLTPEQENRVRHLVHEECYSRDRAALIKLIGLMLLLKLAGRGTIRAVSQLECCRLLHCIIPLVGALMEY